MGKYMTRETFQVIWISYNEDREINALEITNGKRQTVYAMGKKRISQLEDHANSKRTAEDRSCIRNSIGQIWGSIIRAVKSKAISGCHERA